MCKSNHKVPSDFYNYKTLEIIRLGLSTDYFYFAKEELQLSKREFSRLIGLNINSTLKLEGKNGRLSPKSSEKLLMILDLLQQLDSYFGERETSLKWLKKPNIFTGNMPPLSVCDTAVGINLVANEVTLLKYGLTA
ncbi:antitoxin Xre/MbcA/ParS toxin-binding domain-containing protein [Vibrio sp. Y29_XK_CS5]|uniref:antitoxin Xre/MbcA/ParS toxin-binding domain-containing protein n=1 Tax=Vibrio sp. Y29_XK_CS5 TaxID=2957762 RepID=UPI0020A54A19|nr:antitoxin Xre/MbcA/ParS toxin-binding domain-containing protein [Vibrio sp. Y29_XK_CS5]